MFWAIVSFGTHPVYLNPSAHSAVKPWHGGSRTLILLSCGSEWAAAEKMFQMKHSKLLIY